MNKKQLINNLKQSGVVSLAISVLFALYNFYLGFANNYSFGWSIAFYYLLLSCARVLLLKKPDADDLSDNLDCNVAQNAIRIRFFKRCMATGILLVVINLLLIAPISLMVLQQREYNLGLIPAITIATYTAYKVTMAIMHYVKSSKNNDSYDTTLRTVNMTDALVSVLTLQNTMIVANESSADNGDKMRTLTIYTSLAIYVAIVLISVFCLKRLCKLRKIAKDNQSK